MPEEIGRTCASVADTALIPTLKQHLTVID
jgi:hypothetical protein